MKQRGDRLILSMARCKRTAVRRRPPAAAVVFFVALFAARIGSSGTLGLAVASLRGGKDHVQRSTGGPVARGVTVREGVRSDWHPFEGIGALSAGASSRLLKDYPAQQRAEILDMLFKPSYGASLQVLKVEIGGDMQSTDGSEPSHQHARGEAPDCTRGYETWLIKEARARNPGIRTYGLAWGVPGWIGNGSFFSEDNIGYHVSWLQCVRDATGAEIDHIGIWNEMPWGHVWYVEALVRGMRAAGLSTKLVLLDAVHGVDAGFLDLFSHNATFRGLVDAVGLHYPCENHAPLSDALRAGGGATRFWSSEELSTVADWGGAGCWGRMINQNFVRMNATSSIAWSLVWSAYPNLECFGNGLLYAYEPWSGHYEVTPPVWATAHSTQFSAPGWEYLPSGEGAGLLPGGGTYVTFANAPGGGPIHDFSVVIETLSGQCMYHAGCYHSVEANYTQRIRLQLGASDSQGGLREALKNRGHLEVWTTSQEGSFIRAPDVRPDDSGAVEFDVAADSLVTLTTLRTASKFGDRQQPRASFADLLPWGKAPEGGLLDFAVAVPTPPPSAPFPLPYSEDFDSYGAEAREAPYFADQGGAFEVTLVRNASRSFVGKWMPPGSFGARDARGPLVRPLEQWHPNKVLEQRVLVPPIAWNGRSPEPFTVVGDVNWTDTAAEVLARLAPDGGVPATPGGKPPYVGLCVRVARYNFFASMTAVPEGYCLRVAAQPTSGQSRARATWALSAAGEVLAAGELEQPLARHLAENGWVRLQLEARRARVRAWVEDLPLADLIDTSLPFGQAGLQCGYHRCQLDDVRVGRPAAVVLPVGLSARPDARGDTRYLLEAVDMATFVYDARSCEPPPQFPRRRSDFSGFVGLAFRLERAAELTSVGRLMVSGGHPWAKVHNISLYQAETLAAARAATAIASLALPTSQADQEGVEETDDGWAFATLRQPVLLTPGRVYVLASSELASGDVFYDRGVRVRAGAGVVAMGPAYMDESGWHVDGSTALASLAFGPLNALLREPPPQVA